MAEIVLDLATLFSFTGPGLSQAELGDSASAAVHIWELLTMDPEDRIGAEELARKVGMIPDAVADAGHAFTM